MLRCFFLAFYNDLRTFCHTDKGVVDFNSLFPVSAALIALMNDDLLNQVAEHSRCQFLEVSIAVLRQALQPQGDMPADIRVFDGIGNNVDKNLFEAVFIAHHHVVGTLTLYGELLPFFSARERSISALSRRQAAGSKGCLTSYTIPCSNWVTSNMELMIISR